MKLKSIFLSLVLLLGAFGLKAQQQSGWALELGTQTAGVYQLSLGKRWSFVLKAGALVGLDYTVTNQSSGVNFSGVTPFTGLSTRWHLSRQDSDRVYRHGAYLALDYLLGLNALSLFDNVEPGTVAAETQYVHALVPTFGWVLPITDRTWVRASAGLNIAWEYNKSAYSGAGYWRSPASDNNIPIHVEIAYGIRF